MTRTFHPSHDGPFLPTKQMKRHWLIDRQEIADLWFNGDIDRAEAVLDALPYSAIPDWSDVDHVLRVIEGA